MADYVHKMEWSQQKSRRTTEYRMEEVVDYFGDKKKLADITSFDIENFVVHLRMKNNTGATINRKLAVVSKILKYGVRHGVVTQKPEIPKQKESAGRLKFYSQEEEQELSDAMDDHDLRDLFLFLMDTGMRRGEALGLLWDDVDTICNTVTLSDPQKLKTERPRTIPLTARAAEILRLRRSWCRTDEPPFDFTNQQIDDKIKAFRVVHPFEGALLHTCRHTFCSRLVQRGVPLAAVKELAGHNSLKTTLRYSHLTPASLTSAIAKLEPESRRTS
tara:strand:+ start:821 stop:1642 length:822 start_codon:yes stop_codon:yes gene_type:complete